jgi:hypothetical protein
MGIKFTINGFIIFFLLLGTACTQKRPDPFLQEKENIPVIDRTNRITGIYVGEGYRVTIIGFGGEASFYGCNPAGECLTISEASYVERGAYIWEYRGNTYNMSPYDEEGRYSFKIFDCDGQVILYKILENFKKPENF